MKRPKATHVWLCFVVFSAIASDGCGSYYKWQSTTIEPDTQISSDQFEALRANCEAPEGGDAEDCNTAAVMLATGNHGVPEDVSRARSLFRKACAMGSEDACRNQRLVDDRHEPTKSAPAL
jgi:TPR repeat protein